MNENGVVGLRVEGEVEFPICQAIFIFSAGPGLKVGEVVRFSVEAFEVGEVGGEVEECLLQALVGDALGEKTGGFGSQESIYADVGADGEDAIQEIGILVFAYL